MSEETAPYSFDEPSLSSEEFDRLLFLLCLKLGREKLEEIGRFTQWWCRRRPASGLFDDANPRHLWDDLCLDQQRGPITEIQWAWEYDLESVIKNRFELMSFTEQQISTLAAKFEIGEETINLLPFTSNSEQVASAVLSIVRQMALNQPERS